MATNNIGIFTGLFEPGGTEVWIQPSRQEKSEKSPGVYTPPGKIEAPTSGRLSYEIPASSIVKDAFVDVWNDVEGTHYRIGAPTYIGTTHTQGPWFSLEIRHEYILNKRVFTCYLANWSHTWGRWMQLNLRYEEGMRVAAPPRIVQEKQGVGAE